MYEGLLFYLVRQILGVFLGFMGLFLGYLLGWAVFLSLPSGWDGDTTLYRYGGMSVGAAAGSLLAWWQADTGLRYRLAAALLVVVVTLLGAWLGYTIRPELHSNPVSEGIRQFTPAALGAVIAANIAAAIMYYARQSVVSRSTELHPMRRD